MLCYVNTVMSLLLCYYCNTNNIMQLPLCLILLLSDWMPGSEEWQNLALEICRQQLGHEKMEKRLLKFQNVRELKNSTRENKFIMNTLTFSVMSLCS